MSGKIRKSSEDLSFSLSRWFRRMSTAPTTAIVTFVGISYAIFLFGGGLYTLINQPIPAYPTSTGYLFLYPDLSEQFGADTIVSVFLYTLGFVGLLTIYRSSKSTSNPRQAYMMLIVGVTFLLLAYIFLESAIITKGG
jgi:hypothetical protein